MIGEDTIFYIDETGTKQIYEGEWKKITSRGEKTI
jgi:hypothetical protein